MCFSENLQKTNCKSILLTKWAPKWLKRIVFGSVMLKNKAKDSFHIPGHCFDGFVCCLVFCVCLINIAQVYYTFSFIYNPLKWRLFTYRRRRIVCNNTVTNGIYCYATGKCSCRSFNDSRTLARTAPISFRFLNHSISTFRSCLPFSFVWHSLWKLISTMVAP